MPAERLLPSPEAEAVVELARDFAARELLPRVAADEEAHRFPRDVFRSLGDLGLLAMPYPEEWGGGGLPYEVYLQALEEIGGVWASVGVGVSVHAMSCWPLATFGTEEQKRRWLADLLGGQLLGGYCLSEADAGSDPGAMRTRAVAHDGGYRVNGTKAWVTHGGEADFYTLFARTSEDRRQGISCFLCPAEVAGLEPQTPERKMGMTASTTTSIGFDGVELDADRVIGGEGAGLQIALQALDSGRLGHRRRGRRAGPALSGRGRGLRPGATYVRAAGDRSPGPRVPAGGHGRGGGIGSRHDIGSGPPPRPGAAVQPPGVRGQAARH